MVYDSKLKTIDYLEQPASYAVIENHIQLLEAIERDKAFIKSIQKVRNEED